MRLPRYNEEGLRYCSTCKTYQDKKEFSLDSKSLDKLKGTCKTCAKRTTQETRDRKFLEEVKRQAPYVAAMRYMKANPIVFKDFMAKNGHCLQPYINDIVDKAMTEHKKRSEGRKYRGRKYKPLYEAEKIIEPRNKMGR